MSHHDLVLFGRVALSFVLSFGTGALVASADRPVAATR